MANNKSVLVIDDSLTVRKLADSVLSQEGYTVLTAEDGDQGLQIAREAAPSLIIVDFVMPRMNGFQFCKNIRSDSVLSEVPIVLITSKGEEVGKGFDEKFGIVRYLQKPFEADALINVVKDVVEAKQEELPVCPEDTLPPETEHISVLATMDSQSPSVGNEPLSDLSFVEIDTTGFTANVSQVEEYREVDPATGPLYIEEAYTEDSQAEPSAMNDAGPASEEAVLHEDNVLPEDVSFVEIDAAEAVYAKADVAGEDLPDAQSPGAPLIEPLPAETSPAEQAGTADAAVAPEEIMPSDNRHIEPVHADIKEFIEKEFRHYFGQELMLTLKNTVIRALTETDLVRSSRRVLSGELSHFSVADILRFIETTGMSGQLTVQTDEFNSDIYLEGGQIAFASISKHDYRKGLDDLLLKDGKSGSGEILSALSAARGNSLKGGSLLVERGLITDDELVACYGILTEEAVQMTLEATSGRFYVEDTPLPGEIRRIRSAVPSNGSGR